MKPITYQVAVNIHPLRGQVPPAITNKDVQNLVMSVIKPKYMAHKVTVRSQRTDK